MRRNEDRYWEEELDERSNCVIDLIDAGKLDEAERAARDLLARRLRSAGNGPDLQLICAAHGDKSPETMSAGFYRAHPKIFGRDAAQRIPWFATHAAI